MYVCATNSFSLPLSARLSEGFSLCLGVCTRPNVCVLQEEFMLFAVNTAHNGALKSEPPPGSGKWRAPPASYDYSPLPSGPSDPVLTRGRNAIDPDSPQNNQFNSFCPFSNYKHCASLLKCSQSIFCSSMAHMSVNVSQETQLRAKFTVNWWVLSAGRNSDASTNTIEHYVLRSSLSKLVSTLIFKLKLKGIH